MHELTEPMKQLMRNLVIDALRRHRKGEKKLTRTELKNAWDLIEWLEPGERVG